jgi:hypothetical protein
MRVQNKDEDLTPDRYPMPSNDLAAKFLSLYATIPYGAKLDIFHKQHPSFSRIIKPGGVF